MLGGVMWIVKGGLIMLGGPDHNLFIPAQLFFALGLLSLHIQLAGRGGRLGRIGGFLAYATVALSMVDTPYSVFFAEDGPQTPFPFNVTYFSAGLAIFVGLVFLGIVTARAEALPGRWRTLPLIVGLAGLLPIWVLAFIHLEVPVVVLGDLVNRGAGPSAPVLSVFAEIRPVAKQFICMFLAGKPGPLPIASGGSLHELPAGTIVLVLAKERDVWTRFFTTG